MKPSWGKARIGAIAILGAVAFALSALIFFGAAPRAYGGPPPQTLFVTNQTNRSILTGAVTAYPAAGNGDFPPLDPAPTGIVSPSGVAVDASGKIYVTNSPGQFGGPSAITIYAKGSNGSVAPIAAISGSNTGLTAPQGIALDSSGKVYVADGGNPNPACPCSPIQPSVFVYAAGSSGNIAPIATIGGSNTFLAFSPSSPLGIAVDSSGKIYVTDGDNVFVYPALGSSTGTLDEFPTARISGSNTGLMAPEGIAVDPSGKIYVADGSVFVYPALGSSTGTLNEAPTATISGSNTGLSAPVGIAVGSRGKIYVTGDAAASTGVFVPSVFVYPALGSRTGAVNVAPIATISGSNTGLVEPQGIALDSSGKIFVEDGGNSSDTPPISPSVFVYSAGSNGNVPPIAAISGSNTGLYYLVGIAVDSSGKIYVADDGTVLEMGSIGPSVSVYSAGSNGNAAPIATITGSSTGLNYPTGIAAGSGGKIYVADHGTSWTGGTIAPSVLVYPALGSSTGTLDEFPVAGINGTDTGLNGPTGIAVDSGGKIYVADYFATGVFVYAAASNGNVTPIATLSGSNTGLNGPEGIALDSSGKIYVTDGDSVFVYPALGSSTGTLNEFPIATISGSSTFLIGPHGIALDSTGGIYVANYGNNTIAPSVFVYPAGSNGNVAPVRTISGLLTELAEPQFLAIGPTPSGTLSLSTGKLNFGSVGTDTTSTLSLKITNSGAGTLTGSVSATAVHSPLSVSGAGTFNLGYGQSDTVTVKAAPTKAGALSGDLQITSSDPARKSVTVPITGTAAAGKIEVPSSVAFGAQKVGTKPTMKFKVTNGGPGVLHGKVGTLSAPFSVTAGGGSFTLISGESATVAIEFIPVASKEASEKLTITSDDPAHPSVQVAVTGK